MQSLALDPLVSPALWLSLAILGAGLLVGYGLRRPAGAGRAFWFGVLALMGTGLALALAVLLNPTWIEPAAPPVGKPLLSILVDTSTSMGTQDAEHGQSRHQAAVAFAERIARDLEDRFELRVLGFAERAAAVDLADLARQAPAGQMTDLAMALASGLEEERPQGQALVLLSDGIHNGPGGSPRVLDVARLAKSKSCPVFTRALGGSVEVRDLSVEFRTPQELAFQGQKVTARVLIRQRGFPGRDVGVVLKKDGREVDRQTVRLDAKEVTEARFAVGEDQPGLHRYEVEAAPNAGEVSTFNNSAAMLLRVVDKPVHVLLLEGKPYWDAKFLARTLFLDPAMELTSVVRIGDGRYLRRTAKRDVKQPSAPGQEEWKVDVDFAKAMAGTLGAYQIVVLGRDADVFLQEPFVAQLRNWVLRDGGAVVCYRGPPTSQVSQRLSQLLPLRWAPSKESRLVVSLTERGQELHWLPISNQGEANELFAQLPSLALGARPERPKPTSVILATGQGGAEGDSPVFSYQPYGTGRVVVIEGAGMWRWAFLPPAQQEHDDLYRSLWHGLFRWLFSSIDLLPGQKLALRADKLTFSTHEGASAALVVRENAARGQVPDVELRGPGLEQPLLVTPTPLGEDTNVFRVAFGKLAEGRYEARVRGVEDEPAARTVFDVRLLLEEQLDLKARPDLMQRIALDSGGAALSENASREITRLFQERQERNLPMNVKRTPAWDRWWVLLAILATWGLAWGVRRKGGLV